MRLFYYSLVLKEFQNSEGIEHVVAEVWLVTLH
jgi:hypothetical protein